ncbi:MAG: hypothetical protein IJU16_07540 [Clostridia bacterium]|nr:hypothetical protein [Clostridia bacterium]
MKKLLSVLLVVAMLAMFAIPASAESVIGGEVAANEGGEGSTIKTENGQIIVTINKAQTDSTKSSYGGSVHVGKTFTIDANNHVWVTLAIASSVPFKVTLNDAKNNGWIGFGTDFSNVLMKDGTTQATGIQDGWIPAGKYTAVGSVTGYYTWKQEKENQLQGVTEFTIDDIYIEGKDAGQIAIGTLDLTQGGTDQPAYAGVDLSTLNVDGSGTPAPASNDTPTTTTTASSGSAKTGEESNALLFIVIAGVAVSLVAVSAVAAKKARNK